MTAHRALALYQKPAVTRPAADSRADLIRTHGALINRCARSVSARTGVDVDDLWSVGALALVEAAARFEEGRGALLTTFLTHRVRGAMLDEVRRLDRLPRRLRDDVSQVSRSRDVLERRLGRAPSTQEIAAEAHLDEDAVFAAVRARSASEASAVDVEAVDVGDESSIETAWLARENAAAVAAAITKLSERQQLVVALRFAEDLTLKEIGGMLDLSEARVCQLLKAAVLELRRLV